MFKRQRILLSIIQHGPQPMPRTLLVKLAFLLRAETGLPSAVPFYDFVPYRYGPFSFALYHELGRLVASGHVARDVKGLCLTVVGRDFAWQVTPRFNDTVSSAIARIATRHSGRGLQSVREYVYERYPWYASRSRSRAATPRPAADDRTLPKRIYSVGYEGVSVDLVFNALLRHGITRLVDVRANAVSRRYGFAKRTLLRVSARLGIDYDHAPALGIPPERRRQAVNDESLGQMLDDYEESLQQERQTDVLRLADTLMATSAAFMCVERDPRKCHRTRLVRVLSGCTGLPVKPLLDRS